MDTSNRSYSLQLSAAFEEYEGLSESKDYAQATLTFDDGVTYLLHFVTSHRLAQDAEYDLRTKGYYIEENLILVRDVNRQSIESTVADLVASGRGRLLPNG